jgi:hypothetical protein
MTPKVEKTIVHGGLVMKYKHKQKLCLDSTILPSIKNASSIKNSSNNWDQATLIPIRAIKDQNFAIVDVESVELLPYHQDACNKPEL